VLIKGGPLDRCLARAVFVIDGDGTIKHAEYVSEIADEPNYDAALAAAGA
jgi:thiol peroxidase